MKKHILSDHLVDLLSKMLDPLPTTRISLADIKEHVWTSLPVHYGEATLEMKQRALPRRVKRT